MSQNNNRNESDNDATGEVISWVIIFILMFAFPPVGILLLLLKLRGYAKPAKNQARQYNAQGSSGARQNYKHQYNANQYNANQYSANQYNANQYNANQYNASQYNTHQYSSYQYSTHNNSNQNTGYSAQQGSPSQNSANNARQAASSSWDAGNASHQNTAKEVEASVRDAVREVETAAREFASGIGGIVREATSQFTGSTSKPRPKSYNDMVRETVAYQKPAPQKKKKRTPLEKKTGKFVSTLVLLVSIALFIVGVNTLVGAATNFPPVGFGSWAQVGLGLFYIIGGFIAFFSRNIGVKRWARYKKYHAFATGRGIVPISEIARASGQSEKIIKRDIQIMINEGYFGSESYIDNELESLVLSAEAAEEMRRAFKSVLEVPVVSDEASENQYMAIIIELRELNDTIVDVAISDKIDRIEELTAKIFRIVEENPDKLPQIRRFMNYYLPTTLKLLHSYAVLEKQGIQGENITAAKENIDRILDTLATGFEQQLDQLFEADAIDIAADINVLENLMQQDGLTGDKPELKTLESN